MTTVVTCDLLSVGSDESFGKRCRVKTFDEISVLLYSLWCTSDGG
jgi:hypothetical protein